MKYTLLLTLCLTGCTLPHVNKDCGYRQTKEKELVKWAKLPIKLYLHSSFPAEKGEALQTAIAVWNDAMKEPLFVLAGIDTGPLYPRQNARNIIYWGPTREGKNGTTYLTFQGESILDADILINSNLEEGMDIQGVLVHELGHVLGLEHKEGDHTSVMYPERAPYEIRRQLNNADKASLYCGYL